MFETSDGQKIAEFHNIKIGGEKGEYPIVLVGSIFYKGHKIVEDEKSGKFNKEQAEKEINEFMEYSDKTGIPVIVDVVGAYKESLAKFCEFVGEKTDVPFFVDGMSNESRIYAISRAIELGYQDRAIYNSIDEHTTDEDIAKIKEIGVKNAVLLCFSPRAVTPKKKVEMLNGVEGKYIGLIEKAKNANISDFIVDVAVLDIPSISISAGAIRLIKEKLKLPVGCAPINALAEWEHRKMFGNIGNIVNTTAATTYIAEAGANFVMYGSINKALHAFPGIALTDNINTYYRKRILRKEHHQTKFQDNLR